MALFNSLFKKQQQDNQQQAFENSAFYSSPNDQIQQPVEQHKYYQPSNPTRQKKQLQIQDGYSQKPMDEFIQEFNAPINNPYQMVNQNQNQYSELPRQDANQFYIQNNNYGLQQESYLSREEQIQSSQIQPTTEIPIAISKEIRSEKLKQFIIFVLSFGSVVGCSLMLMAYFNEELMGISKNSVLHPMLSIPFLLIATLFMLMSISDSTMLKRSMVKYREDLSRGIDSVPYFLVKNYKNFTRRSVYINWMSFSVYIVGVILLLIFYGLQAQYSSGQRSFYIFFWRIAELKSLVSEIVVITMILIGTLVMHILNIVWTKGRKNNIIGYYGHEIVHPTELSQIKKSANIKCAIITFVVLSILLFVVFIPWLIIRKKNGKSILPIGRI
ncbi:MSC_0882 family membrane protein [Spiroplasma endosymbiont of Othius punctulatus]|uniref:MSC_0882 family membrane protein n=1 Tax=Spiroplasma endosymbiont of Othius punctulatus TaxID=3066289 RepID=UPI0030D03B9C